MAGLCRSHYTEYLVRLVNAAGLDPSPLYTPAELAAAAERHLRGGKPPQLPGETQGDYEQRLRDALAREAPVRPRPPPPKPPLV
ncbi:E3 ubiquitin-protein ligase RNF31-like [Heliangelus exortis]